MADVILVPCGAQLRAEFNEVAPTRDKASDGWIGDTAHQQEISDHNDDEVGDVPIHDADTKHEVHAIDVDDDLRAPDLTMETVVQFLVGRCRTGAETRLRYVIYSRRIWRASNGWRQEAYTGPSPHTEHAHFSFSYDTAKEASTASWHLEDLVALTADDKAWFTAFFASAPQPAPNEETITSKIGRDAFDQGVPNPIRGGKTPAWQLLGDVASQGKSILTAVSALAGRDFVDEQALAVALVALIVPLLPAGAEITEEQLEAAIVGALRQLAAPGTE